MGVQGLWELLAPVGRRVSVETLAGKKLAIDASIWMVQFIKAMRDEKGEMVRNAHLLGFFRRICKLLYLRTKPVFVFDGGTPALKRRTVIARRRQRENAQAKIRKTAEKLLLNHLKAMRLKELAEDLENQKQKQKNDAKGKKILSDQADMAGSNLKKSDIVLGAFHQEKLDEMLAASIAAEEDESLTNNASTSAAAIPSEEEDGDDDEEMILPAMHGNVDPAVLAALPPSMQLDLLVQMRERLMAENRQKYQKVKKAPEKFSELQIQAYLKTVAFRREIDEVQKAAAGRGVGGIQTSRIASEANREFIFSSSFIGDKEALTSARVERNGDKQQQTPSERPPSDSMSSVASISKSNSVAGLVPDESEGVFDDNVETYLDERGHVRVSRVRAMGIRMTRDLQRNLDLMKEIEQERTNANKIASAKSMLDRNKTGFPHNFSGKNQLAKTSVDNNGKFVNLNEKIEQSMFKNETSIEISFEDDGEDKCFDDDDAIFARLAAGNPVTFASADNTPSKNQSSDSASDCDWEEGIVEGKDNSFPDDVKVDIMPSHKDGYIGDESEVEWEEGFCDVLKNSSSCPAGSGKTVSRGYLEEEASLQEAIRRSLVDLRGEKPNYLLSEHKKLKRSGEIGPEGIGFLDEENNIGGAKLLGKRFTQQNKSFCKLGDEVEEFGSVGEVNISRIIDCPGRQLKSLEAPNPGNGGINKLCERLPGSHSEQSMEDASESVSLYEEMPCAESVTSLEAKEDVEQCLDINEGGGLCTFANRCSRDSSHILDTVSRDMSSAVLVVDKKNNSEAEPSILVDDKKSDFEVQTSIQVDDKKSDFEAQPSKLVDDTTNDFEAEATILAKDKKNDSEAELSHCSIEITDPSLPVVELSTKESTNVINVEQKLATERSYDSHFNERENDVDKSAMENNENVQAEILRASLEEEMLILDQECMNLGDEQRKLERNAESVSSEMFAECQELLQMFGLPYIIAPMEAEAQCAYMELASLVDGVVTDDSDVFLFGARSVYKNIFDDRKYVETYFMKDIEKELGITREKLIRMALLLGSDYTEGVSGIGIVNAIEVVNAFPEEDGLNKFREWIESPDPAILGKFDVQTGSSARKRGSKVSDNDVSCSNSNMEGVSAFGQNISQTDESKQSADYIQDIKQIFMDKHRNVSKNWHIPPTFPSEAVISAYSCPEVDKSTEPFSWGRPDNFVLRKLCWEKFGWGSQKSEELLLPVLKEYNKHETQLRLEAFYTFNERFAKIRSKRIKKALKGITGHQSSELMDDASQEAPKSRKKRRVSPVEPGDNKSEKPSKRIEEIAPGNQSNSLEKSAIKQSRKRRISGEHIPSEVNNPEPPMQAEGKQNTIKGSRGNGRGRGRGRGRGVGRVRGKESLGFVPSESSSSDGNSGDEEQEAHVEKLKGPEEVRRSKRIRKPVNYAVSDLEIDDADKLLDQNDKKCSDKGVEQDLAWAQGDADAGFNGKKHHREGDPALEEGFSEEYLERGGGFCTDEGEICPPGVSQNDNPSFEAEFSEDYLKMGGGFCIDETETGKDQNAANPATIPVNADLPPFSGFMDEADRDELIGDNQNAKTDDYSKVGVLLQENTKTDTGTSSIRALSAMPFLRRKRRKS